MANPEHLTLLKHDVATNTWYSLRPEGWQDTRYRFSRIFQINRNIHIAERLRLPTCESTEEIGENHLRMVCKQFPYSFQTRMNIGGLWWIVSTHAIECGSYSPHSFLTPCAPTSTDCSRSSGWPVGDCFTPKISSAAFAMGSLAGIQVFSLK